MPNVRVETATPQQLEQAARMGTTAQAGMRAYKDPVSGQLRDQTPEEMMEGGHAKAATFAAPKSYSLPSGATVMPLDESFMMNAVVGKDAAGKVRFQCVGSGDTAAALSRVPSAKEHRHDH